MTKQHKRRLHVVFVAFLLINVFNVRNCDLCPIFSRQNTGLFPDPNSTAAIKSGFSLCCSIMFYH